MITLKKSYAEHMLHLAIALSILQTDPENTIGYGWDSNLDFRNSELHVLRAIPAPEYPYANQKAIIPLIDDLVRFARPSNIGDITAYLLNVHNDKNNTTTTSQEQINNIHQNQNNSSSNNEELELFLNSAHFSNEATIFDQNAADLMEYPGSTVQNNNLPFIDLDIKLEPIEMVSEYDNDIKIKQEPGTSTSSQLNTLNQNINQDVFLSMNVKEEEPSNESNEQIKIENINPSDETEIVEVLWKQDVDLGYSLANLQLSTNPETIQLTNSEDEVEKLKALEELKEDKTKDEPPKDELDDEWAGIPFTIDNETGEYIRVPLQLDEILEDVLQLANLATEEDQEQTNSKTEDTLTKNNEENLNLTNGENTNLDQSQIEVEVASASSPFLGFDNASDLSELDMMIQSATPFQHHRSGQGYPSNSAFRQSGFHHPHQSRVSLSRGVSMEQRLQDIANLFNPIPGMGVGMGVGDMSPYSHYPTHYAYQNPSGIPQHGQFHHPSHPVLHNTSLSELGPSQPHYGHNLGSAVTSSMHLTNASHDSENAATGYKMEHDMMYYSNTTSEMNQTDGFINSILNDEDLQLMDMGVNESFCAMRLLDANTTSNNSSVLGSASGGSHSNHIPQMPTGLGHMGSETITTTAGDRLDASSDSAVSSMGSERVPSLSDGEWGDTGSDSAQDFHHGKYIGPYDYSYNNRLGESTRHPVAQKKHHMFGKRYFHENSNISSIPQPSNSGQLNDHILPPVKYEYDPYGLHQASSMVHSMEGAVGPLIGKDHVPLMSSAEMKYACSLDFTSRQPRSAHDLVNHNHTYTLPQGSGSTPRPQIRDKKHKKAEDEHLTRDEKRARALNIPITVNDIINLPMDEFNERLSKYDLNENQLSLIRDIRRRGKNKVAAQNCRKRKLDQILCLEDEVKEVRTRKHRILQERDILLSERKRIANKFATLHRHVFQYLRDPDGNPCSPALYSLQQAADGSVYLLRRENKPEDNSNTANQSLTNNNHHTSHGPHSSNRQKE